ncbi:hypothetical protein MNBD_UNCLBAC01-1131 [hydrothermal vent metagenome]|uniref:Peptidase M20 dimerisation domain-containing protein n=1 Tax=hydrothermal vent metagenome TaxID=652676 RepID=A0A3B1DLX3_9ZZZZ
MKECPEIFNWIDSQEDVMLNLLTEWAGINTHTSNFSGLHNFSEKITSVFSIFNESIEYVDLPSYEAINNNGEVEKCSVAPAIALCKRPEAKKQILFVCHMDTVFPKEGAFQDVVRERDLLKGPGVADAKGGIVVMLKVLEAFEQWEGKESVGWKVVLNADEEIGSPSSADFIMETAKKFNFGFVFEPCLPDGNLVGTRKGSGNFTLVVRGKSAHAGRHHVDGRNAIEAAAECISKVAGLNHQREGLTVNIGVIDGGTAFNVVPELAIVRFNVRIKQGKDKVFVEENINKIIQEVAQTHEVNIQLHGRFFATPKILDEKGLKLFNHVKVCGQELGMDIRWFESGGVCDGNRLAAVGLPTVDTLGVRGGGLHSDQEYMEVESLIERVKLGVLSLIKEGL